MQKYIPDVSETIDLEEMKLSRLNRIPKQIFIQKYAPLFFSDDPSVFNLEWVKVSGSIIHEVIMVDNNDEPLYLIPPLRTTKIQAADLGKPLNIAADIYGIRKQNAPQVAESRLLDAFKNLEYVAGVSTEIRDRWIAVFVDCGFVDNLKELDVDAASNTTVDNEDLWED